MHISHISTCLWSYEGPYIDLRIVHVQGRSMGILVQMNDMSHVHSGFPLPGHFSGCSLSTAGFLLPTLVDGYSTTLLRVARTNREGDF